MASITKYPGTLQQTTGGQYGTFTDLNNIKNDTPSMATSIINGKSAITNTPSKILATNFNFNLPVGARVRQVKVEYSHRVRAYMEEPPGIQAPTITLRNIDNQVLKGYAPQLNWFLGVNTATFDITSKNLSIFNNTNFGVELSYPKNTNEYTGALDVKLLRITIIYDELDYELSIQGYNPVYIDDVIPVKINMVDKNQNGYDPTVEIDLPDMLTFTNANGQGTINQVDNTLYWKVPFSSVGMGASITLYFLVSSLASNQILTAKERLTSKAETFIFNIIDDPSSGWIIVPDTTNIVTVGGYNGEVEKIYVKQNVEIPINLIYPENDGIATQMVHDQRQFKYSLNNGASYTTNTNAGGNAVVVIHDNATKLKLKYNTLGKRTITFKSNSGGKIFKVYEIYCIPSSPGILSATVRQLDGETTALMGDGYVYTAQSYLKVASNISGTEYYDCGKNCRMIIFNNEIPENTSDTTAYMIEHAEYVCDSVTVTGQFQHREVDFVYHEEYPLYVIFTSDYSNLSQNGWDLSYTTPCIVEKIAYKGYQEYGNYPYPINNVLSNSNTAKVSVPLFGTCDSFILSHPPLPEWYGSGNNHAVVGIQLDMNVEYSDACVLYAKLHAPDGRTGTRSVVLTDPTENNKNIQLGSLNDLFGFDVLDIQDFNKWQIELQYNNIFTNEAETANIVFNNAVLTIYTATIENQAVNCYVEGKDLRYYGLYLTDAKIPEGLETSTKYLNIDGTDSNEAYRQNIDKKTITLQFDVDGCNLEDTTTALRRIVQILQNKRDSLNRPIPKKIAFSHYPGLYWEYIMTDAVDSDIQISNYSAKVKLVVPSGTAFSVEEVTTNTIGANNSLAKINPVIQLVPSGSEILVKEKYSNQKFGITNTSLASTDIVLIDCAKRTVKVKKSGSNNNIVDITSSVNYDSDWFVIHGEYYFEATNALIQTISFQERW